MKERWDITDRELFLETLNDLRQRLTDGGEYALVKAAALLRQLILDSDSLMHRMNRRYRLKVSFEVCGRNYTEVVLADRPVFYSALGGIHKSGSQATTAESLPLDDFLKTTVMFVRGRRVTVKDIITYAANTAGGVHLGAPRSEQEKTLAAFREAIAFGQPVQIKQLEGVILVVLDGLDPLRAEVEKDA